MNIHTCLLYFSKLLACVIVPCDSWIMNPIHSLSFPIKLVLSIWYLQRKAYNLLIVLKKILHQEHAVLGFQKIFKIKLFYYV